MKHLKTFENFNETVWSPEETKALQENGFVIKGTDASIPDPERKDYTLATIRKERDGFHSWMDSKRWEVFAEGGRGGKDKVVFDFQEALDLALEWSKAPRTNRTSSTHMMSEL